MTSIVSICKLALINIGKETINDLSEASAEAKACNLFYDHVRDTLLQAYPWRFASARKSIAEITNDRSEWSYAYTYPTDCLKVRWVEPEAGRGGVTYPHDAEDGKIYCNLSPAYLRYTKRLTDPVRYPPLFVEALAWHLAVRLAMPLTRDPKVRADAYQLAIRTQGDAATADANEVRETSDHETDFAPDAYAES